MRKLIRAGLALALATGAFAAPAAAQQVFDPGGKARSSLYGKQTTAGDKAVKVDSTGQVYVLESGLETAIGGVGDAAWSIGNGSVIAILKAIDGQFSGLATAANQSTALTDLGAPGVTACASDTGSCSLNALLQRIAQRITSAIAGTTVSGTVTANQGGTWNVTNISGTVSLPTGAATATKQSDGSQKTQVVDGSGNVIGATSNALDINIKSGNPTSITANAGTNLNTSLLALESGGNLASIVTRLGEVQASPTANTVLDRLKTLDADLAKESGGNLATLAGAVTSSKVQTNVAQINGVTPLMGNGVTGTGSPRVTVASDNTPFPVKTDQTTHGTTDLVAADLTKVGGTAVDSNSGSKSGGTLRVVLATDQPQLSNKLLVTPDANSAVNLAQVGGSSTATGHGTASGALRVELPTDGTGVVGLNAGTNIVGKVGIDQTTAVTTNGVIIAPSSASAAGIATVVSSAAEANHVIKASAGNLYGFSVTSGATGGYVLVFNATSAPADGAVTPVKCYLLSANNSLAVSWAPGPPLYLSTGITIGFSTTGCFTKTASSTAFISAEAQ